MRTTLLNVGEPAPWFIGRTATNDRFAFHTAAGRYVVLCLFGSAAEPAVAEVIGRLTAQRERYDDSHLCFFGVSVDPLDEQQQRVADATPGVRFFWDFDLAISTQ